jgi:hypothetical protein
MLGFTIFISVRLPVRGDEPSVGALPEGEQLEMWGLWGGLERP